MCVRAHVYVHDSDVGGEAGMGGSQGWFGKSDSVELRKANLIPSHKSTTFEAPGVSRGKQWETTEELKGSLTSLLFRGLSIHQEQWHRLDAC